MRHFWTTLPALLIGAAAPAAPLPGVYELSGEREMASAIELMPDGRFRYFLTYGALDEQAEGTWTSAGDDVSLVTTPTPVPPTWEAGAAGRTHQAPLVIRVVGPNGEGIALADVRVDFAEGEPVYGYTQEDGWTMDRAETRKPTMVMLAFVMFGVVSQSFAIDPSAANDLTFTFTPNDLGRTDFKDVPVRSEGSTLIVERNGRQLTYKAAGGAE